MPLAEARIERPAGLASSPASKKSTDTRSDKRRFARLPDDGRQLQLLINGSPTSFALHNISAGGVMDGSVAELAPGAEVSVRFENGNVVPAGVRWTDDGLVGLAFSPPHHAGAA